MAGFRTSKIRDLALDPDVRKTFFQLTLYLRVQLRHRQRPAFLFVKEGL